MKSLRLAGITLLAFLTIGFVSCNKDNNGNNTNEEIIEYQGEYPAPENIEYVEDGVAYEIEAIPGQVVIITDKDYNTIVNAVNANGGKIIEQNPQFGYYLIEVALGCENNFITAMYDLGIRAEYNIVQYLKEKDYYVFDDYADVDNTQHGKRISEILSTCQPNSTIKEVNVFNVYDGSTTLSVVLSSLGKHLVSQNRAFVNLSLGYGADDDNWDNMSADEKKSFMKGWKKDIKSTLDFIIELKKKNPNIDIVIANAAGNERCPLTSIINSLKSDPNYKTVLEENLIIVSDYSYYANTSSTYGDFGYIKEHPYYNENGGTTSMATPQALCYINQVMKGTFGEDGKNITAVQALAAAKAAIRQNSNGELDLDEALAMARMMYSPNTNNWDGTSWSFSGLASGGGESLELKCYLTINNVSNNDVLISFVPDMFVECEECWGKNYVIDGNGNLVFSATIGDTEGNIGEIRVTFTRTGATTSTADFYGRYLMMKDDWVTITGLLQGTLIRVEEVGN